MKSNTSGRVWTFDEALAALCDGEQPLQRSLIPALTGAGKAEVERFAACWAGWSDERRRQMIETMAEMAEADFELDFNAIFRWALGDGDPTVRVAALEGLWEDDEPILIEPLVRMMTRDLDERVRAQAAVSLGRFALLGELGDLPEARTSRVRDALLGVIDNPDESAEVRRRAMESVAYLSDAPVEQIINTAYASPDEDMRISAVFAMGRTADPQWGDIIAQELEATDATMRFEAARAAGEIGLRRMVARLVQLLVDPDPEVRHAAVWALGQIGGDRARQALRACEASEDEVLRDAAEEALAEADFATGPLEMLHIENEGAGEDETAAAETEEEAE
jgi:HEAT repeat protein